MMDTRNVDLNGKIILVTGAGSGIGAAAAKALANAGAHVIAAVKPGTGQEVEAASKPILTIECDVRNDRDVSLLRERGTANYGRLELLINNAGRINPIGRIAEVAPSEWEACLVLNAAGAFRC